MLRWGGVRRSRILPILCGLGSAPCPTHRSAFQFDAMGIVQQPVADRIGLIRIPDDGMPVLDRELGGDQGGGTFGSVLDHFHEIAALGVFQWPEEPIIDGQELEAGETVEQPCIGAIASSDGKLMEQAGCAGIVSRIALPAGALDKRASQDRISRCRSVQ